MLKPRPIDDVVGAAIESANKSDIHRWQPGKYADCLRFFVSAALLRELVGADWTASILNIDDPNPSKSAQFLWRQYDEEPQIGEHSRFILRLFFLAECTMNMCELSGFAERLERLRGGHLEAELSELRAAAEILRAGHAFSFVVPTGATRCDFDFRYSLPCGMSVAAEAKRKLEDTGFSDTTILRSLNRAGDQTPANEPYVAFLSFPETWSSRSDFVHVVASAVAEPRKFSSRMLGAFFFWEQAGRGPEGRRRMYLRNRQLINAYRPLGDASRRANVQPGLAIALGCNPETRNPIRQANTPVLSLPVRCGRHHRLTRVQVDRPTGFQLVDRHLPNEVPG